MKKEIIALIGLALGFFLFVAIFFFSPLEHPALSSVPALRGPVRNISLWIGYFLRTYLGWLGLLLPLCIIYWSFCYYFYEEGLPHFKVKIASLFPLLFSLNGFSALLFWSTKERAFSLTGIIGFFTAELSQKYLGYRASIVILPFIALLSAILVTDLPLFSYLILGMRKLTKILIPAFLFLVKVIGKPFQLRRSKAKGIEEVPTLLKKPKVGEERRAPEAKQRAERKPEKVIEVRRPASKQLTQVPKEKRGYKLPPLELLNEPPPLKERQLQEDLQANAALLEDTLRDFGIEAKVVNIERGPVITRYELQPAPGVKMQWIASLADDIALVMKSFNVNVAPVPGKGTIGVEVPNVKTSIVYLREVISSPEFQGHPSLLALALGKKVSGEPLVSDLGGMPHLLIAGATGSGKTVCINALITSLLYRASPDELKFILIDPKMVELAPFNGLPHLIVPVITDSDQAIGALAWAVEEMESRYKLFAKAGLRNIEAYNLKRDKGEDLPDQLPYIVIIIDELADLMLIASKEIEGYIARLAQLSRAVGIHMILATQRPSVDVITGVIKANFPARISFKVASKVDSRTVLDMSGADKLLGKGDMLFIPPGESKPIRAQGSLVSDEEIERVVNYIKGQRGPSYDENLLEAGPRGEGKFRTPGRRDKLYEEAVNIVIQTGQASVSLLQRRLGIGYTRAARLIDMMEEDGIVGPYQGSKPREILVDREEYLRKMSNIEEAKEEDEGDRS